MFDYNRWKNAAPLLYKKKLKKEVALVKSKCTAAGKIRDAGDIETIRKIAQAFEKEADGILRDLMKKKQTDQGATDLLKDWLKTIRTYLEDLEDREEELADQKAGQDEDIAARIESIKDNMRNCYEQYQKCDAFIQAAEKLTKKGDQKQAANLIWKSFPIIAKAMKKEGDAAFKTLKAIKSDLTRDQAGLIAVWLGKNGQYAKMNQGIVIALKNIQSTGSTGIAPNDTGKYFGLKFVY